MKAVVDGEKLEAVSELCYQGKMLSAGDSCELAVATEVYKCALGKFHQLLPVLINLNLPLLARGRI